MIVLLGSNIISGVYTVFEIVLAVALARLLTSLTRTLNVKAIYEDRKKLSLTTAKIPAISDPGLTVARVHFATALVSIIATVLTTTGQFGIVGVTEREYEEVTVKYLVNKAPTGYLLNVQDHISMERKEVSKELLLLKQAHFCRQDTSAFWEIYAFIYDGNDIERPLTNPNRFLDITCVTNEFGFEKKVTLKAFRRRHNSPLFTGTRDCRFKLNSYVERKKVTKVSIMSECAWKAREAWCYMENSIYCAIMFEHSGDSESYLLATMENGYIIFYPLSSHARHTFGTEKLKASPLLLALGVAGNPSILLSIFSSRVERNATVRKIVNPSRQATRIHVPLVIATLVPSAVILFLTICTALCLWIKVIFIPGRQGYNRFNSAADMLSCAAVEKFRDGGCRFLRPTRVSVGLDECGEYASPVKPDDGNVEGKRRCHSDPV